MIICITEILPTETVPTPSETNTASLTMPRHLGNPFMENTPNSSPLKSQQNHSNNNSATRSNRIHKRPSSQVNNNSNSNNAMMNPLLASPTRRPRTSGTIVYTDRFIPSRTEIGLNSISSIGSAINLPPSLNHNSNNSNTSNSQSNNTNINTNTHDTNNNSVSASPRTTSTATSTTTTTTTTTTNNNNNNNNEDQIELQKERQAHETFDAVLKNEIFGEMLSNNINESSIDKIKNTRLININNHSSNNNMIMNSNNLLFSNNSNGLRYKEPATPSPERLRRSSIFNDNNGLNGNDGHNDDDDDEEEDNDDINDNIVLDTSSSPMTPRRLFPSDERHKPSTNSNRGASLFTYRERIISKRPATTSSFLQSSQFMNSRSPVRPDSKQLLLSPSKSIRKISKVPYRVLDAPSLADDFYYDLIDWSSTDLLAVALNKSIFLTDNTTGDVVHLCDTDNEYTSLNWVGAGSHLAVGQNNGLVEIYDVTKKKCIRTLSGHIDRVACLSWNNYILTSGSRDHKILHRDVRIPEPFFETIQTHQQEVCGLKWNVSENKLASGGNDNIVHVFEGTSRNPMLTLSEHKAAVKAMAWSPHKRGILATGGGTADRHLKIWNVNNSTKINDVDTGSQVCNMIWSKNTDEIITSHGYSKYHLTLWDYKSMDPIAILKGHSFRVLHLTLSADGTTVVSGAGDETLRYWKLFEKRKPRSQPDSAMFNSLTSIR